MFGNVSNRLSEYFKTSYYNDIESESNWIRKYKEMNIDLNSLTYHKTPDLDWRTSRLSKVE